MKRHEKLPICVRLKVQLFRQNIKLASHVSLGVFRAFCRPWIFSITLKNVNPPKPQKCLPRDVNHSIVNYRRKVEEKLFQSCSN
jgi:hypothetical protein